MRRPAQLALGWALAAAGCRAPGVTSPDLRPAGALVVAPPAPPDAAQDAEEQGPEEEAPPSDPWYFEALSLDGRRALLRRLDPRNRATFHIRIVDVDSGRTLEEAALPELAKIPAQTIGGKPTELAELEWMLASPAFGRDILKGSHLAGSFPFGACGRLAASSSGRAIAFDAGDWLYVADETGRVRRRLVEDAAYDPRFSPDGRHLFFRRATGTADIFAKYELFVVPSDLSGAPRPLPGTAGMRDRFVAHPDGQSAFAVASQPRGPRGGAETCVVSLSLKAPFTTRRLGCLDGTEPLVDAVISPRGRWAALTTKRATAGDGGARHVAWRLRVLSLTSGKVVRDEPDEPGLEVRAISDAGLLVRSGARGVVVSDVPGKTRRHLDPALELGQRGFFRSDRELVYVSGNSVAVLDVSRAPDEP